MTIPDASPTQAPAAASDNPTCGDAAPSRPRLPPVNDLAPDLLHHGYNAWGHLPYDPSDLASIHKNQQSLRDAENLSLWQPPFEPVSRQFITTSAEIR